MNSRYTIQLIKTDHDNDELMKMLNDPALLTHYVGKLIDCLAQDKLFPPHPKYAKDYEEEDILRAQNVLTTLHKSDKKAFKLGLIWFGLRVSPSFVNIFCPPPDPLLQRRFLVNPEKLAAMIKGKQQPLRERISLFVCCSGRITLEHFVSSCYEEWMTSLPWLDHEVWSNISPNAPSKEIENAARRRSINDHSSHEPNFLEYNHSSAAYMLE